MGPGGNGPMGPGMGLPQGGAPDSMEEVPSGPPNARRPAPRTTVQQGTEAGMPAGQAGAGRTFTVGSDGTTGRRLSMGPAGASPSPRPNRINRSQPQSPAVSEATNSNGEPPAFIGPTGYDVSN
jgi:hypothetical protein